MATNAAMVLAKDAGKKPRELAEAIAAELRADDDDRQGRRRRPRLHQSHAQAASLARGAAPRARRRAPITAAATWAQGEKVNVEYVSANPTGPMHVGHGRGAVFGDALANLLAFAGYDVTREYYINDAGAQVDVLARSAYLRYREALGEDIGAIPDGLYPGDYLKPVGGELAAEHGAKLTDHDRSRMAADRARQGHRHDDGHDPRRSRRAQRAPRRVLLRALADRGRRRTRSAATIEALRKSGEVYEGRLPPPKGGNLEDWEDREQTLFRSTDFGDDVDRPLKKSDGSYTYFASDIAYHKSKFDRGFRNLIDVWGADHGGYIKRMQAAVKAVSGGKAALDVKIVQLVRLLRAGEPVKMSKRAGEFVTLREVVDEVGRDAVRFTCSTARTTPCSISTSPR